MDSVGIFGIWVANKRIYVLFCVLFKILCTAKLPIFMLLISLLLAMGNGPFCDAAIMIRNVVLSHFFQKCRVINADGEGFYHS